MNMKDLKNNKKLLAILGVVLLIALVAFVVWGPGGSILEALLQDAVENGGDLDLTTSGQQSGETTGQQGSAATGQQGGETTGQQGSGEEEPGLLPEDGSYTTKDDVALYLLQYGHLPSNFITKTEAEKLGWSGGSLEPYAPGKCIGGDRFGNREELLPKKTGRTYQECDIDTLGASSRGAKRIVFSNDGLIYYTDDHYESFTLLYGEE